MDYYWIGFARQAAADLLFLGHGSPGSFLSLHQFKKNTQPGRFAVVVRNQEQCCWKGEPVGQHPGEDGQHKVAFGDVHVLRPIHAQLSGGAHALFCA